jgi:hypothetical protein
MSLRILVCLICVALSGRALGQVNEVEREAQEKAAADLRAGIEPLRSCPSTRQSWRRKLRLCPEGWT